LLQIVLFSKIGMLELAAKAALAAFKDTEAVTHLATAPVGVRK
jgi:hypothetical protein